MAKVQSLDDIFGKTRKSTRSSRKPVFEETAEAAANFREKFAAATQTVKKVEEPHLTETKVAKNMSSNPPQSHAPPPTRLADKPLASRPEAGPSNTRSPEQPSYLRPRAPLKTREEVEAAELIGKARGLMGLGEHLEMLMRDPELDPSYLKAQRRREARDRAQEIKLEKARDVEMKAATKGLRAERVAMAREREREFERHGHMVSTRMKHATVAMQRMITTDPFVRQAAASAAKQAAARQGANEGPGDFGGSLPPPSQGPSHGGGLDKFGDEAIRKARKTAALALSDL